MFYSGKPNGVLSGISFKLDNDITVTLHLNGEKEKNNQGKASLEQCLSTMSLEPIRNLLQEFP